MADKLTNISELGEFGLIDHLTKDFETYHKSTVKGVGDDAAVINNGELNTLVSTDLLVEGVHFDMVYTPLKHLGYKAAIVNFSDIAAMNAIPTHITVSVAISSRYSVEAISELYAGIKLACDKYKVDLIGGDTSSSKMGMMISVTVFGSAKSDEIAYRSGAKENDLICVSGNLGAAYLGLLLLEREKEVFKVNPEMQPELKDYEYCIGRFLKPEARIDIVKILADLKIKPGSMIDVSDGLASELNHLSVSSNLDCRIFEEKVPIHEQVSKLANEFHMASLTPILNGGEDYELLFTISPKEFEIIKDIEEISVIGHMIPKENGNHLITKAGQQIELKAQGWNAFKG